MSKTWYPMINYEKCLECGTCVDMCPHSVYNREQAPRPVVVNPEGCVQGCKGCGSRCPGEAIEYFGDVHAVASEGCGCGSDTGDECGCGCDCGCGEGCDCGNE